MEREELIKAIQQAQIAIQEIEKEVERLTDWKVRCQWLEKAEEQVRNIATLAAQLSTTSPTKGSVFRFFNKSPSKNEPAINPSQLSQEAENKLKALKHKKIKMLGEGLFHVLNQILSGEIPVRFEKTVSNPSNYACLQDESLFNFKILDTFFEQDVDVNVQNKTKEDPEWNTPLHHIVKAYFNSNFNPDRLVLCNELIAYFLSQKDIDVTCVDKKDVTVYEYLKKTKFSKVAWQKFNDAFIEAIKKCDHERCEFLLQRGASIHYEQTPQYTPLVAAVECGDLWVIERVFSQYPQIFWNQYRYLLEKSIEKDQTNVMKWLIEKDPHMRAHHFESILREKNYPLTEGILQQWKELQHLDECEIRLKKIFDFAINHTLEEVNNRLGAPRPKVQDPQIFESLSVNPMTNLFPPTAPSENDQPSIDRQPSESPDFWGVPLKMPYQPRLTEDLDWNLLGKKPTPSK